MDILGLGTLAMDLLLQVDSLPVADGFCIVHNTSMLPGGSGTNVIVQSSRLGADCGFLAQIGDDEIGKGILESLDSDHVRRDGIISKKGSTSLHTQVVIARNGEKFIMLNMGDAFLSFSPDDVNIQDVESSSVFYTDLLPYDPALLGLRKAKAKGRKTAFNMQVNLSVMEMLGISKEQILSALAYVDVFAPCHSGLVQLCGTDDLDRCCTYLRHYCSGTFVFTLGDKGAVAYDHQNNRISQPAFHVDVVDTTGAGDSFMGGLLYSYLLNGDALADAMRFSSACAALTCTRLGARSCPDLSQVRAFLSEKK